VRQVTRACTDRGIEYLTLFAFSSENWRRPPKRFDAEAAVHGCPGAGSRATAPEQGAPEDNRRYRALRARVVELAHRAQELTSRNTGSLSPLPPTMAAAGIYCRLAELVRSGPLPTEDTRGATRSASALNYAPEPDLFIRTGGEQAHQQFPALAACLYRAVLHSDAVGRISTPAARCGDRVVSQRERRFGQTSEQLEKPSAKAAAGGGSRRPLPCRRKSAGIHLKTRVMTAAVRRGVPLGVVPAAQGRLDRILRRVAGRRSLGMGSLGGLAAFTAPFTRRSCRAFVRPGSGGFARPVRAGLDHYAAASFWIILVPLGFGGNLASAAGPASRSRRHGARARRLGAVDLRGVHPSLLLAVLYGVISDTAAYFTAGALAGTNSPRHQSRENLGGRAGALAAVGLYALAWRTWEACSPGLSDESAPA